MFNDVLREQYALQKMTAVQYTRNAAGMVTADVVVPRGVPAEIDKMANSWKYNLSQVFANKRGTVAYTQALDVLKMRVGLFNQSLDSAAHKMINWGKNTQWAGRQLTVGLAVPLAAFAAIAGKSAYDVNKQLTRIIKVYDFTTRGAAQTAEAQQLSNLSMSNGVQVAQKYGAALSDTLDVEAQLAASGQKGLELIKSTNEVQRASILGEMDKQDTVKATIALQSILGNEWRKSGGIAENTAKAFNYMNSVENATNLTMQDFVTAIPRALGPLHNLGLSLQDMGVLLATMKSRGIEAAQGANALKSGLNRVLNPTKAVTDMLTAMHINLVKIVDDSGGNFLKIMIALSDKMHKLNLSTLDQQRIVGKLFGTFQSARTTSIIQGLQDIHDKTTQVGRAFEVSGQSAEKWAQIATQEMDKVQQSAAGRFKKAIESIKAQFAEMGKPFLEAATMIVKAFTGIISMFNNAPHKFKVFVMIAALIGGLAGPIIMLTGLMGNLIGQGLNLFHSIISLGDGFKAMTTQEYAAKMLAEQHSYVWKNQANSARALSGAIATLTKDFQELAASERAATAAAAPAAKAAAPIVYSASSPTGFRQAGRVVSYETVSGVVKPSDTSPTGYRTNGRFSTAAEAQAGAAAAAKMETSTEAVAKQWGTIASRAATFASVASIGAMMMQKNTDTLLYKITQVVFIAGLIGPAIVKGLERAGVFAMITGLAKKMVAAIAASRIGGWLAGLATSAGGVLSTLTKFAPAIGIAALGIGGLWYMVHRQQEIARKKQQEINDSAKGWADALGYIYLDYKKIDRAQQELGKGTAQDVLIASAGKMAAANSSLASYLQKLKDEKKLQDAINVSIYEGIKAREHGATPEQATTTVKVALALAGYRGNELNDAIKQALGQVDFSNDQSVVNAATKQFSELWKRIARSEVPDVKTAASGMGKEFMNAMLYVSGPQKKQMFDGLLKSMQGGEMELRKKLGVSLGGTLDDMIRKMSLSGAGMHPQGAKVIKELSDFRDGEVQLAQSIAYANGYRGKELSQYRTLASVMKMVGVPTETVAQAQSDYNNALAVGANHGYTVAKSQQLNLLNYYRLQAGLAKATTLQQGFGNAVQDSKGKMDASSKAASSYADAITKIGDTLKTAYQGAQQAAVSAADNIWNYQTQAQNDALQKQTDAQDKAFDHQEHQLEKHFSREKRAVTKAYQVKINAINKEINQETKAEARRQAIFQAEQDRLQQLAEQANNAIDFNVAVNTGNLDEAAKIFNNMQATQDSQAVADAQKKDASASQKRIDDLNKELKTVEKLRDAKLKALDKEENAEKAALARKKARFDEEAAAKQAMLQREQDLNKMYLDLEIAAITASVPKTTAQYNKQIAQIEAAYGVYGVHLQSYGRAWGQYVGAALSSNVKAAANGLRDEINWQHISVKIANEFSKGAFGLTIKQFDHWMTTGKMPKGGVHPDNGGSTSAPPVNTTYHDSGGGKHGGAHSGGIIGQTGPRNLAGRSPSSQLGRNELMLRAERGEYMINRHAHKALGTPLLDSLNAVGRHAGGPIGLGGIPFGILGGMMAATIGRSIQKMGQQKLDAGLGNIGAPGNIFGRGIPNVPSYDNIDNEALRNAAIIMAVGRKMHGTKKDEITALTVALVESGLHNLNYGDRDSLGLFQQRPSQGWGTPAQIMNPEYSSHAFYAALMRYPLRKVWPIGKAAQIVQRSAYPQIYYGEVPKAQSIYKAVLPSLSTGASIKYDNTIANLHKRETVLTAPLSDSLKRGINNMENGSSGDTYDITIDLRYATIDSDVDIERAVDKAIEKRNSKRGRKRHIGDFD